MTRDRHRHTLESLSIARQSRDGVTSMHYTGLRALVGELADHAKAPPNVRDDAVKVAGLQELGLLGVDRATLAADRPLSESERAEVNRAPLIAQGLVASMPGYESVADAVRHVHERWDGKGYPDGLGGIDTPLASRIVAVAVAYDAMSTPRPYRAAMHPRAIARELRDGAGTQFDPEIVDAMLGLIGTFTDT
jgi:response regulator RpfG family c-di-GMP phosphodiesterase